MTFKSDVEIAQEAQMKPIVSVASELNIPEDELELYGKYKTKISKYCFKYFTIKNVRNFRILLKFQKICASIESAVAGVTALFTLWEREER